MNYLSIAKIAFMRLIKVCAYKECDTITMIVKSKSGERIRCIFTVELLEENE